MFFIERNHEKKHLFPSNDPLQNFFSITSNKEQPTAKFKSKKYNSC